MPPRKITDLIKEHCPEGMGWQVEAKEEALIKQASFHIQKVRVSSL